MEAFSVSSCFPCLGGRRKQVPPPPSPPADPRSHHHHHDVAAAARTFSFEELAAATRNFSDDCLVAAKGAGLYKGHLKSINQVVVIKLQHLADRYGPGPTEQRNSEFLARVLMLDTLRHPNLLSLIGFCADGDHRVLVHEYMPLGSLEDHLLHDPPPDKPQLDWSTRMNIAAGVARGLEYLHGKGVGFPVITSSDILLGNGHRPKLPQYGLAEHGQHIDDDDGEAQRAISISLNYLAPETLMTGNLSAAAAVVYNFGVLLLELITGRRARAAVDDQFLVNWAQTLLKNRKFRQMADPALQGRYPPMGLEEALTVASMCIQQDPAMRSPMGAVVTALSRLAYDLSS